MVNPNLIETARTLPKKKYLVTGASGFVGSHVASVLGSAGHDVVATGRNPYSVPLTPFAVSFHRADLSEVAEVERLVADRDIVIHAAAKTSPWGKSKDFESSCVAATTNLVSACRGRVERLVHVSSTAIHFDFRDATDLTEAAALADPFSCPYASAKASAERVVSEQLEGCDETKFTIIRARAVFGPGDNALLPRIFAAARAGRLRPIGSRQTQTDLTYVDNLCHAILLAAHAESPCGTFIITNGDPVALWPLIDDLLKRTDGGSLGKPVPRKLAMLVAGFYEWRHRFFKLPGEPLLTRYTAGLLSTTKTFDITAARSKLGYSPLVKMREGIERTVNHLTAKDEQNADVSVGLKLFTTGYTYAKAHHAEHGANRKATIRFHAMIAVIDHPDHGLTLFDTGYSPRFFSASQRWPYLLYQKLTPVVTSEDLSAKAVLTRAGIDTTQIQRIIVSHLHGDHACGLHDFPEADVVLLESCWQRAANLRGFAALRKAILPDLIPDFGSRLCLIRQLHGAGFGPFESSHDLFGDGSVRMIELSGHADGQCGVLLQTTSQDGQPSRKLLAADSAWTSSTLRDNLPLTRAFRLLAASTKEAKRTKERLHELWKAHPDVEVILTHCPEVAERYGLDEQLKAVGIDPTSTKR